MLYFVKFSPYLFGVVLSLMGCSRKPIQSSGSLPQTSYQSVTPEAIEQREVIQNAKFSSQVLKAWNEKAGRPTFGIIPAFYQLPVSMPAGAVRIEQGRIFGASYQSFQLSNAGPKPYAIESVSIEQSQAISNVVNQMLDAGVKLVEVSMADANRVMKAEQQVIEGKTGWFPGRQLPSGVGLLVSIQKGQGLYGPAFVGRVIQSKDGQLLALATQVDAGPLSLEPLLRQLIADALRRLAHGA